MTSACSREATRQTRTRSFNEWVEDANESMGLHDGTDAFRCECGDPGCSYSIDLTRAEYESVRGYATRFAVAPNHENPESDRVVSENGRYAIVEKLAGRMSGQARRSNPR
ncbi:MAG: hypothetical protein ACXWZY_11135 [Gaiellaceae bacterium]